MAAKKPQQVKKQEPQKTAETIPPIVAKPGGTEPGTRSMVQAPADEQQRTTTTIQVSTENKGRLEILKGMLNQPDYNSTISRIIDIIPQTLSTEQEIHLVMPVSRFRWLLAHQDSCDCRDALNDAKV